MKPPIFALALAGCVLTSLSSADILGPDNFGYTLRDGDDLLSGFGGIGFPSSSELILSEDGEANGAVVELETPFLFYGQQIERISVSRFGYISVDPADSGDDSTPSCTIPDGRGGRIYANQNATITPVGGGIWYEYYPTTTYGVPLHLFRWRRVVSADQVRAFLYADGDIRIRTNTRFVGAGASGIGVQSDDPADGGISYRCEPRAPEDIDIQMVYPRLVVSSLADEGGPDELRSVVAAAPAGAKVIFDTALNFERLVLRAGAISIERDMIIDASDLDELEISALGASRLFRIAPGVSLSLLGLTLADGRATFDDPSGGAIFSEAERLLLRGVAIEDCAGPRNSQGGGVYHEGGRLQAVDCRFSRNRAPGSFEFGAGGAIYVRSGECEIVDCTFEHNDTENEYGRANFNGGAIAAYDSQLSVQGSSFEENIAGEGTIELGAPIGNAGGSGGAIWGDGSRVEIFDCVFDSNRAGRGDLGYSLGFWGEDGGDGSPGGHGGAVAIDNGSLLFANSVAWGNAAGDGGTGGGVGTFIFLVAPGGPGPPGVEGSAGRGGSGGNGGAIYLENSEALLIGSVLFDNESGSGGRGGAGIPPGEGGPAGDGGAIYAVNSKVNFLHTTITGNEGWTVGGVVIDGGGRFETLNSLIAENWGGQDAAAFDGTIRSRGHNLIGVGDTWPAAPGDLVGTLAEPLDPRLGNADGRPVLLLDSPARDAGSPQAISPSGAQLRVFPYAFDGLPDIGADEIGSAETTSDLDGNGLPDAWEEYFGVSDPLADPDHDGRNNLGENSDGTDPTDPNSKLRMTGIRRDGDEIVIEWLAWPDLEYTLQTSSDAKTWSDLETTTALGWTGRIRTAFEGSERYFRIARE